MNEEIDELRNRVEALEEVLLETLCFVASKPTAVRNDMAERLRVAAIQVEADECSETEDDVKARDPLTFTSAHAKQLFSIQQQFMALTQTDASDQ